ncbi:hypothetical protein EZJ49_06560 [Bdellovibrio bacteriovorus]|uniref:hypothetical protein n=1 Tax=Bdellovibrio bacteriovorus TaxID=959 RepID=UPI0021CDF7A8|nr:hypothetical protein [Bdellovibrio bacteriovorus]UXR65907.1 hypothetical protein EZJ49_06560 [Bdellovibrio bacteriovorus]
MFLNILIVLIAWVLAGCSLDATLTEMPLFSVTEPTPGTTIPTTPVPLGSIDAGFVQQTLPSSLNKTTGHFGSISPDRYYFIQPSNLDSMQRKVVKISGAVKSELALGLNVTSHYHLASTPTHVLIMTDEEVSSGVVRSYIRSIRKSTFTLDTLQCAGQDIDVQNKLEFRIYPDGNQGAYFVMNSNVGPLSAQNGRLYYVDGANCVDTGHAVLKIYNASGKSYIVDSSGSLRQVIAGVVQAPIVDSAVTRLLSGAISYNGDLYFRANVNPSGITTYQIVKVATSTDDSVTSLGFDFDPWPEFGSDVQTINGSTFFYCPQTTCVLDGRIVKVDMATLTATIESSLSNLGNANVLAGQNAALISSADGGRYLYNITGPAAKGTLVDTNIAREYGGNVSGKMQRLDWVQHAYVNNNYFLPVFDRVTGLTSLKRINAGTLSVDDPGINVFQPHSVRESGGEMFFLGVAVDGKVYLYRSDGTNGGTSAVNGFSSDDYILEADYNGTTRTVRRILDVNKEGTDIYIHTASIAKPYLVEYNNGNLKYIQIPGAIFNEMSTRILEVRNSRILIATSAHLHVRITGGLWEHPDTSSFAVQVLSYDGSSFEPLLKREWGLVGDSLRGYMVSGSGTVLTGSTDLIFTGRSPSRQGGMFVDRPIMLSGGTTTVLNTEDSGVVGTTKRDKFLYHISSTTVTNLYLRRAGVTTLVASNLQNVGSYRWVGDTVYFRALDTDTKVYIWKIDTSAAVPTLEKVSGEVQMGEHRDSPFIGRVYTQGTDRYMLFPSVTSVAWDYMSWSWHLWKAGSVFTKVSEEKIHEVLQGVHGIYFISQATSGPDQGRFRIGAIQEDGITYSEYQSYLISLKASPRGLLVVRDGHLSEVKKDLSFVDFSDVHGSAISQASFADIHNNILVNYPSHLLNFIYGYVCAGTKVVNAGLVDGTNLLSGILYRDLDGANFTEVMLPTQAEQQPTIDGMLQAPNWDKESAYAFATSHVPRTNSLLLKVYDDNQNLKFYIVGASGLLDASTP